LSDDDDDEV